jgi:hypothetical protein
MEASSIFIKFLQACITPVAMISGVGLLLLTITNRLGRTIDRTRFLVSELDHENVQRKESKQNEIKVLYKRSRFLRNSIAWIMVGMIASCLIIPLLFIMSFTTYDLRLIGYGLFLISITSMLISFVYFFRDILMGLHAIKLEAKDFI